MWGTFPTCRGKQARWKRAPHYFRMLEREFPMSDKFRDGPNVAEFVIIDEPLKHNAIAGEARRRLGSVFPIERNEMHEICIARCQLSNLCKITCRRLAHHPATNCSQRSKE